MDVAFSIQEKVSLKDRVSISQRKEFNYGWRTLISNHDEQIDADANNVRLLELTLRGENMCR